MPEKIEVEEKPVYFLRLQDLLVALGAPSRRVKPPRYNIAPTQPIAVVRREAVLIGDRDDNHVGISPRRRRRLRRNSCIDRQVLRRTVSCAADGIGADRIAPHL